MALLKSKSERQSMKRLDRIAEDAKERSDSLHDHQMKPDKEKITISEIGFSGPSRYKPKMRQYPNMGKKD